MAENKVIEKKQHQIEGGVYVDGVRKSGTKWDEEARKKADKALEPSVKKVAKPVENKS